ncbi:hypothetical protein [Streptomyces sp. NPDC054863]
MVVVVALGLEARPEAEEARTADFPAGRLSLRTPLQALIADPFAVEVLRTHLPGVVDSELLQMLGSTPLIDLAATAGAHFPTAALHRVAEDLAEL